MIYEVPFEIVTQAGAFWDNEGWETIATGMLMLTVPAEHGSEFQRLAYEEGLAPGVITLEV